MRTPRFVNEPQAAKYRWLPVGIRENRSYRSDSFCKKDRFSEVSTGPTDPRKKIPVNHSVSPVFRAGFFLKKPT
jgi:hypothetical protein